MSTRGVLYLLMIVGLSDLVGWAQETKTEKKDSPKPAVKAPPMNVVPPTHADVPYGKHERQVIDFYQAKSDTPTPLVFYIHGGGWQGGSKTGFNVKPYLEVGISVAAINYRYVKNGIDEKVEPPVKAPLHDAARALQFVRSKAKEWNIDKVRIGATGGSAGGCSSLWLAFHDDLADPKSEDPIARESTRLYCAAVNGAQVTLDPIPLREWMPNYSYGAHAFGLKNLDEVNQRREKIADWIKEYSPMSHVTKDDPAIGLFYGGVAGAKKGEEHPDPTHSPMLGLMLMETLKSVGVECHMTYNGGPTPKYTNTTVFLIERLKM